MRFGPGIQSKEWISNWLEDCLRSYTEQGFGPWSVVEKQSRQNIGYCGLFYFPDINGRPAIEVGYRLARTSWGQGYATEAVIAVLDYGFSKLCLQRIIAMIDPNNSASIRVAEKAGMRYEEDVMLEDYSYPDRVYACYPNPEDNVIAGNSATEEPTLG